MTVPVSISRTDPPRCSHHRVVAHNVVPLYLKPTRDSEMISQTLLGHDVEILNEQEGWSRVQTEDTYRGWVETRWLTPVPDRWERRTLTVPFTEVRTRPHADAPLLLRMSIGARVGIAPGSEATETEGWVGVCLPPDLDTICYVSSTAFAPEIAAPDPAQIAPKALEWSTKFLGTPYLWGGSSSFGMDCSGIVQLCYRRAGITLLRDADIQRDDPRFVPVDFSDLQPGDLVFFGKEGRITHIGMHCRGRSEEGGTFIHSTGGAGVIITPWGEDRHSPGYVDARRLNPARAHEPVTRFEAEDR